MIQKDKTDVPIILKCINKFKEAMNENTNKTDWSLNHEIGYYILYSDDKETILNILSTHSKLNKTDSSRFCLRYIILLKVHYLLLLLLAQWNENI